MFSELFEYRAPRTLCYAIVFMSVVMALAAADTNDIPKPYVDSNFVWGEMTNELRAGVGCVEEVRNGSALQHFQVFIVDLKTNDDLGCVKPPNDRLARFELQDSNRVVILPEIGKELAAEMPQTIQSQDLPRTPKFGRNNPVLIGFLPLSQNIPILLKEFYIQDAYQIKDEGDYTATIWPTIYRFSTNKQFVVRMDFPPVSMKIHLTPSQQK
jgi:hypothetical protein